MRKSKPKTPRFLTAAVLLIVGFLAGYSTGHQPALEKTKIVDLLKKDLAGTRLTARFVSDRLFLEGIAENDYEADRAVELAKAYLGIRAKRERSAASVPAMREFEPVLIDMIRIMPPTKKEPTR